MEPRALDRVPAYLDDARRFARSLLRGNYADYADDVVHEAVLRVSQLDESGKYDSSKNLKSWFLTAVRLQASRVNRRKYSRREVSMEKVGATDKNFLVEDNTPLDILLEREKDTRTSDRHILAISTLSQRQKTVLNYRLSGLTNQEISQKMGLRAHSINNIFAKVRKKLNEAENL